MAPPAFPLSASSTPFSTASIDGYINAGYYYVYEITITSSGTLKLYTTGGTDTYGYLYNASEQELASHDGNTDFTIEYKVTPGTYYVKVKHYYSDGAGAYTLHQSFTKDLLTKTIQKGWHLVALDSAFKTELITNQPTTIGTMWSYKDGNWNLKVADSSKMSSKFEAISNIDKNRGYWLLANSSYELKYNPSLTNTFTFDELTSYKCWHLLSTYSDITDMSIFANTQIVWSYANSKWSAYSPHSDIQSAIATQTVIGKLSYIPKYSGFWVYNGEDLPAFPQLLETSTTIKYSDSTHFSVENLAFDFDEDGVVDSNDLVAKFLLAKKNSHYINAFTTFEELGFTLSEINELFELSLATTDIDISQQSFTTKKAHTIALTYINDFVEQESSGLGKKLYSSTLSNLKNKLKEKISQVKTKSIELAISTKDSVKIFITNTAQHIANTIESASDIAKMASTLYNTKNIKIQTLKTGYDETLNMFKLESCLLYADNSKASNITIGIESDVNQLSLAKTTDSNGCFSALITPISSSSYGFFTIDLIYNSNTIHQIVVQTEFDELSDVPINIDNLALSSDTFVLFVHGLNSDFTSWAKAAGSFAKALGDDYYVAMKYSNNAYQAKRVYSQNTSVTKTLSSYTTSDISNLNVFAISFSSSMNLTFDEQGVELKKVIDKIKDVTKKTKVILIGHSMGGLASRAYIQNNTNTSVKQLISVGTPHYGVPVGATTILSAIGQSTIPFVSLLSAPLGLVVDGSVGALSYLNANSSQLTSLNSYTSSKYSGIDTHALIFSGIKYSGIISATQGGNWGDGIVPEYSQKPPYSAKTYLYYSDVMAKESITISGVTIKNDITLTSNGYSPTLSYDETKKVAGGAINHFDSFGGLFQTQTRSDEVILKLAQIVSSISTTDDYPNEMANATLISVNSLNGKIEKSEDVDYFKITLTNSGKLTLYTTGSTDTQGTLYNSSGEQVAFSDDEVGTNFKITQDLAIGTYYLEVKAYQTNTGDYTLVKEFTQPTTLQAPTNLIASDGVKDGEIDLTWSSVDGATHYEVYWASSYSGNYAKFPTNASDNDYHVNGVTPNTPYYFEVKACNDTACSEPSSIATGSAKDTTLQAPTNLIASDGTEEGKIKLSWSSVSGATHYEVHYSTSQSGPYSKTPENAKTNSATVTATKTNTYYFKVKACNDTTCSEPSSIDSGYIKSQTTSTTTTSSIGLLKTGQSTSHADYDDGYYKKGITRSFTRNSEIVTDNVAKLMWQDDSDADTVKKNWQSAKDYCEALSLGGYSDWRLPDVKELLAIVDNGRHSPSIDPTFQNVTSFYYWSSTTRASNSDYAWYVEFEGGETFSWAYHDKTASLYVRCVRAGQ